MRRAEVTAGAQTHGRACGRQRQRVPADRPAPTVLLNENMVLVEQRDTDTLGAVRTVTPGV